MTYKECTHPPRLEFLKRERRAGAQRPGRASRERVGLAQRGATVPRPQPAPAPAPNPQQKARAHQENFSMVPKRNLVSVCIHSQLPPAALRNHGSFLCF